MNKTLYASIPLYCNLNEFQDILEFTYGNVMKSIATTSDTDTEDKSIYKYNFYIWDKIEIIYNVRDNIVKIYKCLETDIDHANQDSKNTGERDIETMIDLVIETIILSIISMDQNNNNNSNNNNSNRNEEHKSFVKEEYERLDFKNVDPIITLFKEQFGSSFSSMEGMPNNGLITLDRINAQIDFNKMKVVRCNSNPLRGRIESLLSIGKDLKQSLCWWDNNSYTW